MRVFSFYLQECSQNKKPEISGSFKSARQDLNLRPLRPERSALPN